jgi:hypothetical protein
MMLNYTLINAHLKKYLQQTGQTEEYLDLEEEGDAEGETTV